MNIQGIRTFMCPVKDIAQAKAIYEKFLGVAPYMDEAYYVGYKVGNQEIGLDPDGYKQGMTGPVGYYQVGDIKKTLQLLLDAGAKVHQEAKDVGRGKLITTVQDGNDNMIGLMQLP